MMDRGFIRISRTIDFGAIAAPAAGGTIVDEGDEDEYGLDELDAFADTTDEVDVTEIGLRVKSVPPMTALNLADAEDLRTFLEAERRRKHLCGSDVEVEDSEEERVQNQESEVVEPEIVDLVSEDELNNWDADESSVVVFKQDDNEMLSSTSDFRMSSIPQAESETLRRSPRKRNRVSSDSNDLPVYKTPGEWKHVLLFFKTHVFEDLDIVENKVVKHKSPRRSSSRSQRPRSSPKFSVSSVVVQDDSEIPSTSNFRMPSIPQAEVVEHEIMDLVSEDEWDNWDVDESSVVVFKQDDSDIPSSTSNFRTPSIHQAESETLRKSPRKRNRVSSDSNDLPVYKTPGELKYIL